MNFKSLKLRLGLKTAAYSPQSVALFAVMEADGALTDLQKILIDTTMRELASENFLQEAVAICIVGHVANKAYNLARPTTPCTLVGAPTTVPWQYFKGAGSINEGFDSGLPLLGSGIYTQNSGFFGALVLDQVSTTGADCGTGVGTRFNSMFGTTAFARPNGLSDATVTVSNSLGPKSVNRTASGTVKFIDGQVVSTDIANVSSGITAGNFTGGYAGTNRSSRRIHSFWALNGLSDARAQRFHQIMLDYALATGASFINNITLTEPVGSPVTHPYFIFNDYAVFEGTMIGTALDIEIQFINALTGAIVQVNGNDWNVLVSGVSTGSYRSAFVGLPKDGVYLRAKTRLSNLTAETAFTSCTFTVGDVGVFIGDSLAERSTRINDGTVVPTGRARRFTGGRYPNPTQYGGRPLNQLPIQVGERAGPYPGDGCLLLDNLVSAAFTYDCDFSQLSIGGTGLCQWVNGGVPSGADPTYNYWQYYTSSMSAMNESPEKNVMFVSMRWGLVNDLIRDRTPAQFAAQLTQLMNDLRTFHENPELPIFIIIPSTSLYSDPRVNDASFYELKQLVIDFIDANEANYVYCVGDTTPLIRVDDAGHWDTEGRKDADAWTAHQWRYLRGLETHTAAGPKPANATATANTARLYVTHNGGSTLVDKLGLGHSVTGFRLFVDDIQRTITASTVGSDYIEFTFDGAAVVNGVNLLDIDLYYGQNPVVTNPVYDNYTCTGTLRGFPLQSTRGKVRAVIS